MKFWIIYATSYETLQCCIKEIGHKPSYAEFKKWSKNSPRLLDIIIANRYPEDKERSIEFALSRRIKRPHVIEVVERRSEL